MIPSPDESGRQPRRDRTDERRDLPPELRVVVLDDCLADACRTAQDILDLAADVRINMIDIRGGDLLQRLLRRARRAGRVRALIKAAHERFPDHDDLTWLHDSMFGRPPSRPAPIAGPARAIPPAPTAPPTPAMTPTSATQPDRATQPDHAKPSGAAVARRAGAGANAGAWTHETVEVAGQESQQMIASPQAAARVK